MLNSFFGAAQAGEPKPAAMSAAARIPVVTRANGFILQPSWFIRCDRVEDWREPSTPILATEASRAFIPPCTRDGTSPGRQLSDQPLRRGAGTLAANSSKTEQLACQEKAQAFSATCVDAACCGGKMSPTFGLVAGTAPAGPRDAGGAFRPMARRRASATPFC